MDLATSRTIIGALTGVNLLPSVGKETLIVLLMAFALDSVVKELWASVNCRVPIFFLVYYICQCLLITRIMFLNFKHLYFLFFTAISFSCKNAKTGYISNDKPIVINLDSNTSHYSLIRCVDDAKIVNLETNKASLISGAWNIQKVLYVDNKYFILDGRYMAVKVFDSLGRYLYDVGKLGVGKGAFVKIDDLEYYSPHNSLIILCNSPSKISEYSISGSPIKDSRLDFYSTAVAFPSANSRIFYVNQNKSEKSKNKNLLLTDSLNLIGSTIFDMPKNISNVIKFSGGLFSTSDGIFFNPAFSDTYYSIVNDTVKPVYQVNYGHGAKKIAENVTQEVLLNDIKRYSFQYNTFIKNKDYIGFTYFNNKKVLSAFFDIHSGNTLVSDTEKDSLNLLFSNLVFECGEKYLIVLDMKKLSGFIKRHSNSIKQNFPGLYEQVDFNNTNPNLSLLIFKLKPNQLIK